MALRRMTWRLDEDSSPVTEWGYRNSASSEPTARLTIGKARAQTAVRRRRQQQLLGRHGGEDLAHSRPAPTG